MRDAGPVAITLCLDATAQPALGEDLRDGGLDTGSRPVDHVGDRPLAGVSLRAETNGSVEKSIQTIKEQVLRIERFHTLEQLRGATVASPATTRALSLERRRLSPPTASTRAR